MFSITSGTELSRTKIPLRFWFAAIWHLHVDKESISALGFARRYGVRHATAWKLMHKVRAGFIMPTPRARGATAPFARRNGAKTARLVNAARDEGALTLIDDVALSSPGGPHARESAAVLGRLRAWLTTVYCGVRERYLHLYLAEFASRFGRKVNAA